MTFYISISGPFGECLIYKTYKGIHKNFGQIRVSVIYVAITLKVLRGGNKKVWSSKLLKWIFSVIKTNFVWAIILLKFLSLNVDIENDCFDFPDEYYWTETNPNTLHPKTTIPKFQVWYNKEKQVGISYYYKKAWS